MCRFDLKQMDQDVFEDFHNLVLAVFDEGKQRVKPRLRYIGHSTEGLDESHADFIMDEAPLGLATANLADAPGEFFDIWMSPSFAGDSFYFRKTLAHELVHGYTGIQCGHNAHWRRWVYRVLMHLHKADMILTNDIHEVCFTEGWRYIKDPAKLEQEDLLIEEVHRKVNKEHDRVLAHYFRRTHAG